MWITFQQIENFHLVNEDIHLKTFIIPILQRIFKLNFILLSHYMEQTFQTNEIILKLCMNKLVSSIAKSHWCIIVIGSSEYFASSFEISSVSVSVSEAISRLYFISGVFVDCYSSAAVDVVRVLTGWRWRETRIVALKFSIFIWTVQLKNLESLTQCDSGSYRSKILFSSKFLLT